MKYIFLLVVILSLYACQPAPTSGIHPSPTISATPENTSTPTPTPQPTLTSSPTATASPTPNPLTVCIPLEGETLESLSSIIVNPLDIPPFGKDTGHHGVDFAYYQRDDRESIQGIEVYAFLSGTVVLTLDDKMPYGYAILIETPLSDLPKDLGATLQANYLPVPDQLIYQGNCPKADPPEINGDYSVYHLYAHFETLPPFNPGDIISCGTTLGTVGNSGYSSNPHLHLETRLGPSGASFESMAFYDTTASQMELATYCLWRMSGYFQLFDPFTILNQAAP